MLHQGTRLPRESSIVLCDLTENSIPCFIVTGISWIQSFILTQIRQHKGDSLSAVGARHGLQGAWSPVNLQDTVSAINVTTVCLHAITSFSQTDTAINFCSSGPSTWFGFLFKRTFPGLWLVPWSQSGALIGWNWSLNIQPTIGVNHGMFKSVKEWERFMDLS